MQRYKQWTAVSSLGFIVVASVSCGGDGATNTEPVQAHVSPAATAYLNAALDVMQKYSFYRSKLDWTSIRDAAAAAAVRANAQGTADTYPAIRAALVALGDHHSFLQPPVAGGDRTFLGMAGVEPVASTLAVAHQADSLDGEIVGGRYGYVRVPTFSPVNGGTAAVITSFADTLQALVRAVDTHAPCGWIVDLRHNLGGNMWPMLAGIGPIVGDGTNLGSFVDATGSQTFWSYSNGSAGAGPLGRPNTEATVSRAPYVLRNPNPMVAVLTDARTASSGEAITVAFRGRAGARSFGAATFGVPTGNEGHALSDGAFIWLMEALDVDRNGNQYIDAIPPDQVIATTAVPATDDAVVVAAMAWLGTQVACAQPNQSFRKLGE